jgi:hypothetical protein
MASLSVDLLAQAEDLLTKEKKKPKQANVRRAISTAYYALFHFISDKVTKELVGTRHDQVNIRTWMGRALTHGTMKDACVCFANPNDKKFSALSVQLVLTSDADLKAFAAAFVDLQELREQADYDLSIPITRKDAKLALTRVRSAFAKWGSIKVRNPKLIQVFSISLLHWKNLSKRS